MSIWESILSKLIVIKKVEIPTPIVERETIILEKEPKVIIKEVEVPKTEIVESYKTIEIPKPFFITEYKEINIDSINSKLTELKYDIGILLKNYENVLETKVNETIKSHSLIVEKEVEKTIYKDKIVEVPVILHSNFASIQQAVANYVLDELDNKEARDSILKISELLQVYSLYHNQTIEAKRLILKKTLQAWAKAENTPEEYIKLFR